MAHILFFKAERPRELEISDDGDMAPSMSFGGGGDRDKRQEDTNITKIK
jgi:hypothetical protein